MPRDNLKHQVSQQFLSRNMTLTPRGGYIAENTDAAIGIFSLTTCKLI